MERLTAGVLDRSVMKGLKNIPLYIEAILWWARHHLKKWKRGSSRWGLRSIPAGASSLDAALADIKKDLGVRE